MRKLLAALGVGVLAALALGAPAYADRVKPTAVYNDSCARQTVNVTVATTGDEAVEFAIKMGDKPSDPNKVEGVSITKAASPKNFKIEGASGPLTLWWKTGAGAWEEAGSPHTWSLGAGCKPSMVKKDGDCDNAAMTVTVTNPALDGVETITAGSRTNAMNTVIPKGASATFSGTADFTIYVSSTPRTGPRLFDTIHETYQYKAPTGCTKPIPTTTNVDVTVTNGASNGGNGGAPKGGANGGGDESLPVTGSNTGALAGAGVLLLILGTIAVVAIRRRRNVRFTA